MNGSGLGASEWIQILQELTLRTDLRFLTMISWKEVLPQGQLLRPKRAWCPACYEEWREQEAVIYEPLLWALKAVTVCQQTRDLSNLSYALDALAAVESQTGGRESVATLLGAAEGQREAVGSSAYRWCGPDIELRQRNADAAGERLGHDAYQRAFDAGYSLTLDGAVELVRRQILTTE